MFKIQDTGCYNINVTFASFPKDGLLEFVTFKSRHVSSLPCFEKLYAKYFFAISTESSTSVKLTCCTKTLRTIQKAKKPKQHIY